MKPAGILFVCLGNICRSPLAEGIFRHLVATQNRIRQFEIASAGTGGWHIGDPPDPRSIAVAKRNGIDISAQRGRKVVPEDFERFDLILGMDRNNVATLQALAPAGAQPKIHLFSMAAMGQPTDVPDPYYGGSSDFEAVYSMLFEGCSSLLGKL
ncbi:low molecular weight protein-tyrosine-phosphatase [Pararhizobium sp.]|uniref:low molecular weight protein-tyrosine-phosphatase n=1 Tax=Pararhizobium sp. TaxID=1977563 RepID=UPI002722D53A|nr:low molecular weight protein-tyrosine-phosphatase [Pararhizobium sp.]MDO9416559.1 low molecular weight protein-tyrosine-phosphatase [Pararhizobium sp.]